MRSPENVSRNTLNKSGGADSKGTTGGAHPAALCPKRAEGAVTILVVLFNSGTAGLAGGEHHYYLISYPGLVSKESLIYCNNLFSASKACWKRLSSDSLNSFASEPISVLK